jgi:hypothetical protein
MIPHELYRKSTRLLDGFDELGSLEMVLEVAMKGSYEFGELGFLGGEFLA